MIIRSLCTPNKEKSKQLFNLEPVFTLFIVERCETKADV